MLTLPSLLVNAASDDFFEGGRDAQSGRTANDFLIRGLLPDQPAPIPGLVSHAGQLSFPEHGNSAMFFWLMTNSTRKVEDRLVIYLNGGPGCTSMDGALLENSPLMFDEKTNKLVHREWNLVRQSAVLYIDQPVGTGYSFGPISSFVKTFDETASRLVDFLDRFYALFPKMKSLDVYIAGESEAGVYIPYTAREILKRNAVKQAGDRVNLRGIALGNGWIDSEEIVRSYPDYAERHGLYAAGDVARDRLKSDVDLCLTYLKTSDIPLQQPFCESIMFHFSYYSLNKDGKCLNVYHVGRVEDAPGCGMNWPPKVHIMIDYLNRKDVQQALHVKNDGNNLVTECNSAVGSVLRSYKERVPSEFLPELASHMKIMLYYGDQDILCNYLSAERLLAKTEWNGARGFSDQTDPVMEWSLDGSKAGYVRAARNMTYVRIFNASHMVGVEKPKEFVGAMSLFLDAHQPSLGTSTKLDRTSPSVLDMHPSGVPQPVASPNAPAAAKPVPAPAPPKAVSAPVRNPDQQSSADEGVPVGSETGGGLSLLVWVAITALLIVAFIIVRLKVQDSRRRAARAPPRFLGMEGLRAVGAGGYVKIDGGNDSGSGDRDALGGGRDVFGLDDLDDVHIPVNGQSRRQQQQRQQDAIDMFTLGDEDDSDDDANGQQQHHVHHNGRGGGSGGSGGSGSYSAIPHTDTH